MDFLRPRATHASACVLALAGVTASVVVTNDARAQTPADRVDVQLTTATLDDRPRLLERAQAAATAGDAARAYELARVANALQMTPSVSLFLARQAQSLRRPQDALSNAEDCLRVLGRDATVRFREQLTAQCTEISHQVRSAAGFVRLRFAASSTVRIVVAGQEVPASLYGLPFAVVPGEVSLEWHEDRAVRRRAVTVARGETFDVAVETFTSPQVGADDLAIIAGGANAGGGREIIRPVEQPAAGPGVGPWVLVGVGGAATIAGGVLWGMTRVALADCTVSPDGAIAQCDRPEAARSAPGYALGGNIAVPTGLALVAGGVAWYAIARALSSSPARPEARSSRGESAFVRGCVSLGTGVECAF